MLCFCNANIRLPYLYQLIWLLKELFMQQNQYQMFMDIWGLKLADQSMHDNVQVKWVLLEKIISFSASLDWNQASNVSEGMIPI